MCLQVQKKKACIFLFFWAGVRKQCRFLCRKPKKGEKEKDKNVDAGRPGVMWLGLKTKKQKQKSNPSLT